MKTSVSRRATTIRPGKSNRTVRAAISGNGGNGKGHGPSAGPKVSAWLRQTKNNLIGGKWVEAASGKMFDVFNPANGTVITRVPESDREDINRAVAAARKAFEFGPWPRMTPSERGKLVWRIGDLILEHADELAELESVDNGKPRAVARGADVPLAADMFHY